MPGFDPYGPKNWQKTKPKKQTPLRELFGAHFSETLNPEHPLYVLAERIDWQQYNITIDACYAEELGRCRLQSSKAAALDRFFAHFGTVAVAGGGAALQIAPQAASAEPLTDKSKFTQIAIEQSAGSFSGTTRLFLQVSCPFGLAMPVKLRTIRTLFSHIYKLMGWAGRATGGYAA